MTDNQIRKLERLAAQGDVAAYQELWFARQRIGLPPWEWWPEQFANMRRILLERKEIDPGSAPRVTTWQTDTPQGYSNFDVIDTLRLLLGNPFPVAGQGECLTCGGSGGSEGGPWKCLDCEGRGRRPLPIFKVVAILIEDRPQEWDRNDLGVPTSLVTPVFMYVFMEAGDEPRISGSSHWGNPMNLQVDNWARMRKHEPVTIEEALTRIGVPIHHVPLVFFPGLTGA
jgi:hypothetical protein